MAALRSQTPELLNATPAAEGARSCCANRQHYFLPACRKQLPGQHQCRHTAGKPKLQKPASQALNCVVDNAAPMLWGYDAWALNNSCDRHAPGEWQCIVQGVSCGRAAVLTAGRRAATSSPSAA